MKKLEVELSQEEWDTLLSVLGEATAKAVDEGYTERVLRIVKLTNRLNTGNPDWLPYDISVLAQAILTMRPKP